jgi:hypothetical protein
MPYASLSVLLSRDAALLTLTVPRGSDSDRCLSGELPQETASCVVLLDAAESIAARGLG